MRILITGTKWTQIEIDAARKAIEAARKKYGDDLTIVTGYTAPHIAMAFEAERMNVSTVIFAPDLGAVQEAVYSISIMITITSLDKINCQKQMVATCDSVIALNEEDPIALEAMSQGKRVWFPIQGKVT